MFPIELMIYLVGEGVYQLFGELDVFIEAQLTNLSQVASNDVVAVAYQLD